MRKVLFYIIPVLLFLFTACDLFFVDVPAEIEEFLKNDGNNSSSLTITHTPVNESGSTTVTITYSLSDVLIYYTVDGTTPSSTSKEYTSPFEVDVNSSSVTVKAIAYKDNTPSLIAEKVIPKKSEQFTVTFDANGATGTMPKQTFTEGIAQNLTKNTFSSSNPNTTFAGWATDASATTIDYADGASYTATADVTLYAVWKTAYTLSFELKGGTGTATDLKVAENSPVGELPVPVKVGYTFAGWQIGSDVINATTLWTYTENKTAIAQWTINDYTITYELDGGINTSANHTDYNVETETITLQDATRTGYTFDGWYSEAGFTSPVTKIDQGSTGDKTFYAKWLPITYTVEFDANGGTGSIADQTFTYDVLQNLTANNFSKTGFHFAGWAIESDKNTVKYADEASVENLTNTQGFSVTLYAVWADNPTYTVTFDANDGTGTMATQIFIQGVQENLDTNSFTRDGYTFENWNTNADGSGTSYADGENYTATADATLYAQWTEWDIVETPVIDVAEYFKGTTSATITCATTDATIEYKINDDTTWTEYSNPISISNTSTIQARGNATGYIASDIAEKTTTEQFTVIFDRNSADVGSMDDQVFTDGIAQNLTKNTFTKTNYSFAGWNTQTDGYGTSYADEADYTAIEDTTLYAQWTVWDTVATPVIDTLGTIATATGEKPVTITTTTNGATIFYTIDGTDPANNDSIEYKGEFNIDLSTGVTVKAIAVKTGMIDSGIAEQDFEQYYPTVLYIDGVSGNDSANGFTSSTPVKTMANVMDKLAATGDCTIWVMGTREIDQERIWSATPSQSITLKRYTDFTGAFANVTGGTLTLENITLDGQGGIDSLGGSVDAQSALITVGTGAELVIADGAVLQNNKNTNDTTGFEGGAVYANGNSSSGAVTVNMTGGTVKSNSADLKGGGIYVAGGTNFTMSGGTIESNTVTSTNISASAIYGGGGVHASGKDTIFAIMENSIISNNTVQNFGGGIYINTGTLNIEGGTIAENTAKHGGGIIVDDATVTMSGGTIKSNIATNSSNDATGGGIYAKGVSTLTISGGSIELNKAKINGGGIYLASEGQNLNLSGNPEIKGNTVSGDDNNIYRNNDSVAIAKLFSALTSDATIGLSPKTAISGSMLIDGSTHSVTDSSFFKLDDGSTDMYIENDNLYYGTKSANTIPNDTLDFTVANPTSPENVTYSDNLLNITNGEFGTGGTVIIAKGKDVEYQHIASPIQGSLTNITKPAGVQSVSVDIDYDLVDSTDKVTTTGANIIITVTLTANSDYVFEDGGTTKDIELVVTVVQDSADYYVSSTSSSPAGNDETGDGSSLKPFATVQKAIDAITETNEKTIHITGEVVGNATFIDDRIITFTGTGIMRGDGFNSVLIINNRSAEVTLDGPTITGGNATSGGGVQVSNGTFTMQSGSIIGNEATTNGGGVYVNGASSSTANFIMNGGTIGGSAEKANTAANGGGICTYKAPITINGGEISHNTATTTGGGIRVNGDGAIVNISNNPVIYDNTISSVQSNVTYSYTSESNKGEITIAAEITDGAKIGITPHDITAGTVVATVATGVTVDLNKIFSDASGVTYNIEDNSIKVEEPSLITMIAIEGGTFDRDDDGSNVTTGTHEVTVDSFMMGETEVTQVQWEAVMTDWPETSPSDTYGDGDNYPAYYISWYDAVEFCNALSEDEGLEKVYTIDKVNLDPNNTNDSDNVKWTVTADFSKNGYRLPTEAEWEYAAGGGANNRTTYAGTDNSSDLGNYAWYDGNASKPHEVKKMYSNLLELYDMSGNVDEWCWDWHGSYDLSNDNPYGRESGSKKIYRGGSFFMGYAYCNVLERGMDDSDTRSETIGFRVARTL